MISFTLRQDKKTGLYFVCENGRKVTNPIYTSEKDFEGELRALGLQQYTIETL
jgi:hypothetical protein